MSLSIGIVGLPNVGKSTLFNALIKTHQAKVADYPFTTIEPNIGIVKVPDARLRQIAHSLRLDKQIPATIKFIDIAGLVKNAHQGEGLGNQFLSHIREVDAILHVIDGFSGKSDPQETIEIINLELEMAEIKKPTLYVFNIKESDLKNLASLESSKWVASATGSPKGVPVERTSLSRQASQISLSAKLEAELTELSEVEQKEYLESLGLKESGLVRLIKESYQLLHLITFYTLKLASDKRQAANDQIQAWPILAGTLAPEAAGKVHTDMARGFIAAEVCHFDDLISAGGWREAHQKGLLRTEGKNYQIQDGEVILFKFNV